MILIPGVVDEVEAPPQKLASLILFCPTQISPEFHMDRFLFGEDSILRRLLPFMTNTSAPEGARWTKETVNADVLKAR